MKKKKIFFLLIIIFFCFSFFAQEFGTYENYIKSDNTSKKWNSLIKKGYDFIEKNNFEKAISFFEKAIEKGCNNSQIMKDLLLLYLQTIDIYLPENKDKTVKLSESIKDDIVRKECILLIADFFNTGNFFEEADELYKKAKITDDKFNSINIKRGDNFFIIEKYDKAIIYYEKANEKNKIKECNEKIKEIKEQEKIEIAKKELEENIKKLSPNEIIINLCKFENSYYSMDFKYSRTYEGASNVGAFFTRTYTDEKYIINKIIFNSDYNIETQIFTLNKYILSKDECEIIDYTSIFIDYINKYLEWYEKAKGQNIELNKDIGKLYVKLIYDKKYKKFAEINIKYKTINNKYYFFIEYPEVDFLEYDAEWQMFKSVYKYNSYSISFSYDSVIKLKKSLLEENVNNLLNIEINKKIKNIKMMEEFN